MEIRLELSHVDYQCDGPVAVICLNQPESGNTLSRQMALDLFAAADHVQNDDAIRAVVFSAHGPMFSFGGDLKEFKSFGNNSAQLVTIADQWHKAQQMLLTMPKPVVVGVNGMAAAAVSP